MNWRVTVALTVVATLSCEARATGPEVASGKGLLTLRIDRTQHSIAVPGRLVIDGPTDTILSNLASGATDTIQGLAPGPYQIALEYVEGSTEVVMYDEVAVTVVRGELVTVSMDPKTFQPAAPSSLGTPSLATATQLSVSQVFGARRYEWEYADDVGFTAPTSRTSDTPSIDIAFDSASTYFARVRAVNQFDGKSVWSKSTELKVLGAFPEIALSEDSLTFSRVQGEPAPLPQVVEVSNGGSGTLGGLALEAVSYSGGPGGWLDATLSGPNAPASVTLTVDPGGLPAGSYAARVNVTSVQSSNSPQPIEVTLDVDSPPTMVLSDNTLAFSATVGGSSPPAQSVRVSNGGGGTLGGLSLGATNYSGSPGRWLNVGLSGSTAPATVTLTPLPLGSFPVGTYTATIPVMSPQATNPTELITATLNISPNVVTLVAVQDAFVVDDALTHGTNYNTAELFVGEADQDDSPISGARRGSRLQAFVQFNLGAIPAGAVIDEAHLIVTRTASGGTPGDARVRLVEQPWAEASLNWNIRPNLRPSGPTFSTACGTCSVDVTSLVRDWIQGTPNYGLALTRQGGWWARFTSREGLPASQRPTLRIVYH